MKAPQKPLRVRDIALLSAASALLYGVQVALAALPNVEGVTLLIILFTLCFGYRALWSGSHALCRRLEQYARRLDRRLPV